MIGVIATIRVKDGAGPGFEEAARKLVDAVNANEPGCKLYVLGRTDDSNVYVFVERYEDEAAAQAHRQAEHLRTVGAAMGEFMAGRPEITRFEEL